MAPSKLRRAIGAVKDQTSISLAKVANTASRSDLEVAIVKATSHEECPADERHIREILSLISYSNAYVGMCVSFLSRRLSKTKNWTVALKTLMLMQRLLSEGNPAYEQEVFFSTRRGTRILNMSDFRDASGRSDSWYYSAFVRTYALYLDERLEFRMHGRRAKRRGAAFAYGVEQEEEDQQASTTESTPKSATGKATPVREMKTEHIFVKMQHLLQLLERFLACRPTGSARYNRVVLVVLYPIIKESFQLYYEITEILGILVDRFMELEIAYSVKVYEIICRVAKQFEELEGFYCWCKDVGIARSSEYPEIEKITQKKLDLMDEFIRDKSTMEQAPDNEEEPQPAEPEEEQEEAIEEDMNKIKALPAPEEPVEEVKEEPPAVVEEVKKEEEPKEADLLNLGADAMSSEAHTKELTLALFDGAGAPNTAQAALPWHNFTEENPDWETALVLSATNLSNQPTTMGGNFNMMLLDGMYQKGALTAAALPPSGSTSSVALGSAGRPAALALPAPPTADGKTNETADPFTASLSVAPPSYVQMSDLEKKQKLLLEEQQMWQHYAREGMRGEAGLAHVQRSVNSYNAY